MDKTIVEGTLNEGDSQTGASITWQNLTVSANIEKKHIFRSSFHLKEIIHNVNGYARSNSLIAILGASGSGKSTLMSALASRQTGGLKVEGDVLINGRRVEHDVMKKISGFVFQDDAFTFDLTVSEHLHFAAKLKLSKRVTNEERDYLVKKLIIDVGLADCSHRLIGGSEKKNLSGGELKRLSVATELITDPFLLFCDEPTTGLDSFTAFNLMKVMSDLTRQKAKTIICSIHQPSTQIFELFDQIVLLQNGRVAFNGTTDNAMVFFQSIGYPYNENQNPAEYLVKSLAAVPVQEFQPDGEPFDVCAQFQQSQFADMVGCGSGTEQENRELDLTLFGNDDDRISWFYMFYLQTYRNFLSILRNPREQIIQILNNVLVASVIGVFVGRATPTQEGMGIYKAVLYGIIGQQSLVASQQILFYFPTRISAFLREDSNYMNTPSIFYASNFISMIPAMILDVSLFVTILYSLSNMQRDWYPFLASLGITLLCRLSGCVFGIMMSFAIDGLSAAQTVVMGVELICNPLTGIWIKLSSIPAAISWIRFVSWMTYGLECMFILQMVGIEEIACSSPNLPCLKNGQEVLQSLGFEAGNFRRNVIAMGCICLILQVLAYVALRVRLSIMRNR